MIPRLWEAHGGICDARAGTRTDEPRKTAGEIGRYKRRDGRFKTGSSDELERRGNHKVCEGYVPEFIEGCECLSEGIQDRIQLWEAENIASLKICIRRRVRRRHIVYIEENAVKWQL